MRTSFYIFEDSEAVIKHIDKDRSLAMRHVSRTHRVDSDWLDGRVNLDPMIQITYINTSQQLADIVTKGSSTGDRWTQLTLLVNIVTHTPITQSNLSVSSEVVNPLFASRFIAQDWLREKISDKNVHMDYLAAPPPKHQARGDTKRENLCQPDSGCF